MDSQMEVEEGLEIRYSAAISDLSHQLGSPLLSALRRLRDLRKSARGRDEELAIARIEGLVRHADSIRNAAALYLDLGTERLVVQQELIPHRDFRKLIIEVASDAHVASATGVGVDVARWSFKEMDAHVVADPFLLRQALTAILDNATKYSVVGGRVLIDVDSLGDKLVVNVESRGLPLLLPEVALATRRGWRSELAQTMTPSGQGLGLWIADQALSASGASLQLSPSVEGVTVVTVVLPTEAKSE